MLYGRYYAGFYQTTTGISFKYTCSLPLELPPDLPPHPTLLGGHRAPGLSSLCYRAASISFLFTRGNVYVSVLLSKIVPPFPPHAVSKVCSLCAFIPALQIGSPVPFF